MSLQPIGHRVLVLPDAPPDQTTSGLILPQDRDHVPVSGTVVAVGPGGSAVRYRARQRAVRDCAEILESFIRLVGNLSPLLMARDEIAGLLGTSDPEHEIHVGDRVVFPDDAGLKLTEDGTDYVLLNEDEIAVIVADEVTAA